MKKEKIIFDMLVKFSMLFKDKIQRERIIIYSQELAIFEIDEIVSALNHLKFTCVYFPALSEIAQLIKPVKSEKDIANEKAVMILKAASNYSQYDKKSAEENLGELWPIAEAFGWSLLTTIQNDQVSTTRAQLRDFCLAYKNPSYKFNSEKKLIPIKNVLGIE